MQGMSFNPSIIYPFICLYTLSLLAYLFILPLCLKKYRSKRFPSVSSYGLVIIHWACTLQALGLILRIIPYA